MSSVAMAAQRDAFAQTLIELIDRDERVYVLDGDLANSTRADRVALERPGRFLEMGIAEQNMMGVAAGMAACGLVPWLSSFACFLVNRDLDQVRVAVAQPRLNVKIAGAYSGLLTGKTGKTHQEVADLAVMRAMPNMTVLAPADAVEVRGAMLAANDWPGPVYLRLTRDPHPIVCDPARPFEIGPARRLREGSDVTIVATGEQSVRALEAAGLLAARGISALVLHVPTIKPLDAAAVVAAAAATGRVLTAEDHSVIGGLGSAVCEALSEHCPTPVRRLGIQDCFGESAGNQELLRKYGLAPEFVAEAAAALVEGRAPAA
ncbi:MAG: transketolase C-terminal domain-containing protein [Gemmatimonadota bacterium]